MLDKILIKEVVESSYLQKSIPMFFTNKGLTSGKETEARNWKYDITDTENRLWNINGSRKPIPHKELHRNQELYGEFGLFTNPENEYAGSIKDRFTKKEFDDKVEKKIAYLKALIAGNQKEVERLESLK